MFQSAWDLRAHHSACEVVHKNDTYMSAITAIYY